jgi:hypothetical protein
MNRSKERQRGQQKIGPDDQRSGDELPSSAESVTMTVK